MGKIVGGKILFDGVDLLQLSEAEMREYRGSKISMILQDPMASLNPVYTVGEQVAEPLRQHQHLSGKALWDQVTEALRLLRIPSPRERLQNYPHQMSGGMRQRVVGGIAIVVSAKADHRRRADDRARRDHSGAVPGAPEGPAAPDQRGDDLRQPRFRHRRRGCATAWR